MTAVRAVEFEDHENDDTTPEARLDDGDSVNGASAPSSDLPGNDSLDGLARMAGVGRLAAETACSTEVRDMLQELLTHELVAGHAFAMNVLCQANNQFLRADRAAGDLDHLMRFNAATAQTGMVGVRMMEAVQRGILLLDRVRNGVRYRYTVDYVGGCPRQADGACVAPASDGAAARTA